jgi:hypothetical protein
MSKQTYRGLLIADLHLGAMNLEKQYEEIKTTIYSNIRSVGADYIIFLGDYFDHKASLNDSISYYSFKVFQDILAILREEGLSTKIRFVYGTESHEWNQYKIIENFKSEFDIKVIHYCEEEELFPDVHVLYVPEEHLRNKGEYYKPFLENAEKYDYIFGHGCIREVMKVAAIANDSGNENRKKVPFFTTGELLYACRGQVFFGHYHIHTNIDDTVFYVGSFSRWCYGEEEEKGIYSTTLTIKNNKRTYDATFIENTLATTYKTISFGYENSIFKDESIMTKKLDTVDSLLNDGTYDNVRYEFNVPPTSFNPEYIINYLKERYKYNNSVKVNIVHGYADEKKKQAKAEIESWTTKNAPLFDKSLSIEDKVAFFIGLEFKREIPVERIKLYLNNSLSDILKKAEEDEVT